MGVDLPCSLWRRNCVGRLITKTFFQYSPSRLIVHCSNSWISCLNWIDSGGRETDEPEAFVCATCQLQFNSCWRLCHHCQTEHSMNIYENSGGESSSCKPQVGSTFFDLLSFRFRCVLLLNPAHLSFTAWNMLNVFILTTHRIVSDVHGAPSSLGNLPVGSDQCSAVHDCMCFCTHGRFSPKISVNTYISNSHSLFAWWHVCSTQSGDVVLMRLNFRSSVALLDCLRIDFARNRSNVLHDTLGVITGGYLNNWTLF